LHKKWIELKKIRDICNISIEAKRASKEIGSSLEANLTINLNEKLFTITKNVNFSELCITSEAKIEKTELDGVSAITTKAEGKKCPICWKINKIQCERHPI
jgi:isoleucyl-tRNA synthetase